VVPEEMCIVEPVAIVIFFALTKATLPCAAVAVIVLIPHPEPPRVKVTGVVKT